MRFGLDRLWTARRGLLLRYAPSEAQHLFGLTLVLGALCGLAAVAFHLAIRFAETQLIDRAMSARSGWAAWTLLTPTLGGLLAGVLLHFVVPLARGSGIPQVKEAYALEGGRLRLRDTVGKFLIGALQIGSGASLGREGPTVQICAGIASSVGRATGLSERSVRRLLPVGVAAGIAAAFNAPVAAVTFTIEEVIGTLDQTVLSGVVVAAALAAVVERSVLGAHPVIDIARTYSLEHASSLLSYVLLGLAAGGVSRLFTDWLLAVRAWFRRLRALPRWAHPALGGAVTGALAILAVVGLDSRGVTGGGYETLSRALLGQLGFRVLVALCALKLLATVASYSSGGAGGIFAPALFIGAMLGGATGFVDVAAWGHAPSEIGAFALVGMGAVFAGIIRAPITSVLIIFEMTNGYGLVLPLMIANTISYLLARHWRPIPIYEALLEQDGVYLPRYRSTTTHPLDRLRVRDAMTRAPVTLVATLSVAEAFRRLRAHSFSKVPVMDEDDHFRGFVDLASLRELAARGEGEGRIEELVTPGSVVSPEEPLIRAVLKMSDASVRQLAVVGPEDPRQLLGIVTMSDVLRAHAGAAAARAQSRPILRVRDVMSHGRPFTTFRPSTPATEMLREVSDATWQDVFPVIDAQGRMIGLVSAEAMRVLATEQKGAPWALAADVMQPAVSVHPEDDLREATRCLVANRLREVPVLDRADAVVGFLDEAEIASVYLQADDEPERRGAPYP